ncbi:type IA DNA topoisomerase [Thermoleophilum album]|uniref:DNA topoisomerase n=1 Tax=Thermoleophilum album TaxID=29539 RepID=A0A1H6FNZ4_THEAL|nr:type IA DNA topoisomerase [Thermoleophilum album]SEH12606.1 DNA topoisomerase-3 [Thermoleophilum album]
MSVASKTLVVAEKPSVGRDIARALDDRFKEAKDGTHLVGERYIVTWAIGHLVTLAEPDAYDARLKRWRFSDLPILPERFKLVPNDAKSERQLRVIHELMRSDEVAEIVNACDAGREGELIFAYVYETAGVDKPVKRLWLSSMTRQAIREAFENLRPGEEMKRLEAAARSRSEADWVVGMNATRAATIRLRSAFDGAVSLGRVQTPTLALVTRREQQIRDFKPEPYWLIEAAFAASGERTYRGRYLGGKRIPKAEEAQAIADAVRGRRGTITKLEKSEERERPQLLYDLTSLQRHANVLFGFSARRTLNAAQRLYEEHKAITYPRTNSRYLTGDLVSEIKPTAELVGRNPQYARAAEYVLSLERLPLQRVVDDTKVEDHHALIPTRAEHDLSKMGPDELRIYDLVVRRFLAVFHPDAVYERTRVETTVEGHVFRTSGRRLVEAGWKAVYGEQAEEPEGDDDSGGDQLLPKLERGEEVETRKVDVLEKETQPPRRYTDASLLAAMETAGREIEDPELREALKDSGIGTPATRAAIIERLIEVGYLERDGRTLRPTEKGMQVIRLLGDHPLTSAELTGEWERRLALIERGQDTRPAFMRDIADFTTKTVEQLDQLKNVRIERARLGPCPICGREIVENRRGFSCWSKDDPGCGFVIWKRKAGKTLSAEVAKELIESLRASIERGDNPPVGRTEKPVTGFKGRSGRTFRARLRLERDEQGRWRVEFDEQWAQPREGEDEGAEVPASGAATNDGSGAAAVAGEKELAVDGSNGASASTDGAEQAEPVAAGAAAASPTRRRARRTRPRAS